MKDCVVSMCSQRSKKGETMMDEGRFRAAKHILKS